MSDGPLKDNGTPPTSILGDLQPLILNNAGPAMTIPFLVPSGSSEGHGSPYDDEEDDVEDEDGMESESSSSSDMEWGRVTNGLGFALNSSGFLDTSSEDDDGIGETAMFVPEPVYQLEAVCDRPSIPYHSEEELPPGTEVWVCDAEDVATFLQNHWSPIYEPVCNGKLSGVVRRHSGNFTLVEFYIELSDLHLSLTIPRACLSLTPLSGYEAQGAPTIISLSSGYLNLGPRAQKRQSMMENDVCQQLYETLGVLKVTGPAFIDLGYAVEKFEMAHFEEALKLVDKALASSSASLNRVDGLVLRSRINVFLDKYEDALADANEVMSLEPNWVRGHLCAARALSGLGQFIEAGNALRSASLQVIFSDELEQIKDVNNYMLTVQQKLSEKHQCIVSIDSHYRKQLRTRRPLETGTLICTESNVLVAMKSLAESRTPPRCCVCFREGLQTDLDGNPFGSRTDDERTQSPQLHTCRSEPVSSFSDSDNNHMNSDERYCSKNCHHRASLYAGLEKKYESGLRAARKRLCDLLLSDDKLSQTSIDVANLTMRLFFIVFTTYRRIKTQQNSQCLSARSGSSGIRFPPSLNASDSASEANAASSPMRKVTVDQALKRLGVYPLVSSEDTSSEKDMLTMCYVNIASTLPEHYKKVFTRELFGLLYSYCKAYLVTLSVPFSREASLSTDEAPLTLLCIPNTVGWVRKVSTAAEANTQHVFSTSGSPVVSCSHSSNSHSLGDTQPPLVELVTCKPIKANEILTFCPIPNE